MKTKSLTSLFSLTFLFLFSCGQGVEKQLEVQREYWDDEKRNLKFEISHKNKKRHGTWTSWYENGELKSVTLFDNGELVKFAEYTETGTKRIKRSDSKDQRKAMTEVWDTKTNQTCGNIKYSIINFGPDDDYPRNHIVANVFNNDGEIVLKADSYTLIELTCKDVTGNGQPELIFDTGDAGSCACCHNFYIITENQTNEKSEVEILYEGTGFNGIYYDKKRSLHEVDQCASRGDSETLCLDNRDSICKGATFQKWE